MSPRSQILRLAKTLSLGNEKHQTFAKALLGSSRGKKDGSAAAAASCCLLASTKTKKRMRCISNSSKQASKQQQFLFDPSLAFVPK